MNLDVMYVRSDGRIRYEHVNPRFRWIQEPDGDHAITKDVIYQDIEGRAPPVIWIWQDIPEPEHPEGRLVRVNPWLVEAEFIKKHHLKKLIGRSKLSSRSMISGFVWMFKSFYFGFFIGMVIFALYIILALLGVRL